MKQSNDLNMSRVVELEDLEINLRRIAYENVHAPVFHAWLKLDSERRREGWRDRYVFYSCACCLGGYIEERLKHDFEGANAFVRECVDYIRYLAEGHVSFTEEWFKGIDRVVGDLARLSFVGEARILVAIGLRTGVKKFPRLEQSLSVHAAYLDSLIGRLEKAEKVALRLIQRPYLLPSRRDLPEVLLRLMFILGAANRLREYRLVLWTGVNLLWADASQRDIFSAQISKTYRGALRACINPDVPLKYRLPYVLANLARILSRVGVDRPLRGLHLLVLYIFDRLLFRKNELFLQGNVAAARGTEVQRARRGWSGLKFGTRKKNILITRAMGGIGDVLMMTPGLRALKAKYPNAQIDFAIPKGFHPLLEGLPGVNLIDIHEEPIILHRYKRWINLTDCPAGRVEARQAPNVRRNRIEIFALAMGVSRWRLRRTGYLPFYRLKEEEVSWARARLAEWNPEGRPVIGIQPFAADSYKNWPYMEQLAADLSREYCVLLFHNEIFSGYEFAYCHKVIEPLRKSIALASLCQRLVVPDSSFHHISAALQIPTVVIFGAISGRLFTKNYSNVLLLAPQKRNYPCYPCWRHEHKACHISNGRESICLRSISVDQVIAAVTQEPWHAPKRPGILRRAADWILFGNE